MKIERKLLQFKVDQNTEEEGVFSGMGSGFGDIDQGGDIVAPNAFDEFLQNNPPDAVKALWQHDQSQPMGYYRKLLPTSDGLQVEGKILPTTLGKDALILMKGDENGKGVDGLSIGYIVREHEFKKVGNSTVRVIKKADLIEISVVTFPMNLRCRINGVKKMTIEEVEELKSLNDVEDNLRDNGYSKNAAVAIIAKISEFKRISDEGEPQKEYRQDKKPGKPMDYVDEEDEEVIEEDGNYEDGDKKPKRKKPFNTDNTFPAQKETTTESEEARMAVSSKLDSIINNLKEIKG